MGRIYHKCHLCGDKVSEQKVTVDYRWGEELITGKESEPS
jgi:hypothetical protein